MTGVRLGIAGSGLSAVDASISVSGDFRISGPSRVTVVSSVVDELDDDGVTTVFDVGDKDDVDHKITLLRHTGETAAKNDGPFAFTITESTVDSFMDAELVLNFSGVPAGAEIVLDAWLSGEKALRPPPTGLLLMRLQLRLQLRQTKMPQPWWVTFLPTTTKCL